MSNTVKLLICLLLIVWLIPIEGWGQPSISGNLSGNLGPGLYLVIGNCTVPAGQSLVIAPGTTLLFTSHFFLTVNGQLTAVGTAVDSIKFLPYLISPQFGWGGLRFENSSTSCNLSYCRVDYTRNLFEPTAYGGAIFAQNATLNLSHSRLTNSQATMGGGLYGSSATLTIADCEFAADTSYDDGAGLYAIGCPITITGCNFHDNKCYGSVANGGGICLDQCNQAQVSHCIITANHSDGG